MEKRHHQHAPADPQKGPDEAGGGAAQKQPEGLDQPPEPDSTFEIASSGERQLAPTIRPTSLPLT